MKKIGRLVKASDPETFIDLTRLESPPASIDETGWFYTLTQSMTRILSEQYQDIYWSPVHPKSYDKSSPALWLAITAILRVHLPERPTIRVAANWPQKKIGVIDIKVTGFDWPNVGLMEASYGDYAHFTSTDTNIIELQLMAEKLVNIMRNPEIRQG